MRISDEILAGFLTENGHARFLEVDIAFDLRDERALADDLAKALTELRTAADDLAWDSNTNQLKHYIARADEALAAYDAERGKR